MVQGLADRLYRRGLVFHHVPKCGGTSVGVAIRRHYALSQAGILPGASFRAAEQMCASDDVMATLRHAKALREQMLLYHLFTGVWCVSAHVRFSDTAFREFQATHGFVTILREPIARYLSHYHYSVGRDSHVSIDLPLEAFIETEQGRSYGAMYCDYLASLDPQADFATDAAVRAAIANLDKFAVVGFLDDLEGFAAGIRREFGFRPRIGHRNRNEAVPADDQRGLSAALRKRIEAVCAPDLEIFHAARARARAAR
jgi:hypothetical protein